IGDVLNTLSACKKMDCVLHGHRSQDYERFWNQYRVFHEKHQIFETHHDRLGSCVPCMLHTDEGTGMKKKAVLILQIHPVMGMGSKRGTGLNFMGSTYLTRLLYTTIAAKAYKGKTKGAVLQSLFNSWTRDLLETFNSGVRVQIDNRPTQVYLVMIACKGDWPALVQCGSLTRHFGHVARGVGNNTKGICHLCKAGMPGFSFSEFGATARWYADTEPPPLPWNANRPPKMLPLVMSPDCPEKWFKIDIFHTCHKGCFSDLVSSAAVLLRDLGFYGEMGMDKFCNTLYEELSRFAKANGLGLHMVHLNKKNWFKGADTTTFMRFLQYKYERTLADHDSELLDAVLLAMGAANKFLDILYNADLWMDYTSAHEACKFGMHFLKGYATAATLSFNMSLPRFKFQPKWHMFAHITHQLYDDAEKVGRKGRVLNVLSFSCQQDEDFVGKISAIVRKQHARSVNSRVLQKYKLNLASRW
ncbi:unnamed protein product, partial [Symbiodinium necroappetens]